MLIYTTDREPGICRKRAGRGFYYLGPEGKKIDDSRDLKRIKALAIPPAYENVWICPIPAGHLQATGRDAKRRKQYRYHEEWNRIRKLDRFGDLARVGEGLPKLRRRVRADLKAFEPDKECVTAVAVRLIDKLGYRVGNDRYLRENRTRGVSTLSERNVEIEGESRLEIEFKAKGGQEVSTSFSDKLLAEAIKECQELPGQRLFRYKNVFGEWSDLDSSDINAYLKAIYKSDITAKDLRTWRASTEAVAYLMEIGSPDDREGEIRSAIRHAAEEIGNRYETCRKHYVHPKIGEAYENSGRYGFSRWRPKPRPDLQRAELVLLRLLDES